MSFEDDVRALVELVKKQGASELTEDVLKQLHTTREELEAYSRTFGRRVPSALRSSLRALNGAISSAAMKNVQLLDIMESEGIRDYDPSRALHGFIESHVQQARQEGFEEATRLHKSRLHTERANTRADLMRKGWTKPLTVNKRARRKVLEYLHYNPSLTVDVAAVLLFEEFKGDWQKVVGELSQMRREGYLARSAKSVYEATEIGRRYDPNTGELPATGKINDRTALLRYLQEIGGAAKEEIDAVTASASVLFNSVRDGVVELRDGRYYVSEGGMTRLQRIQEHPADPRAAVMQYLMTHGIISNGKAREITKLSKDKAAQLLNGMRAEGVIAYAGAAGNVLADGHRPQIELKGYVQAEQVLHYAVSHEGTIPRGQLINLFPGTTPMQRSDLAYRLIHDLGYLVRRDGNLVMTQRGYERIGLMPVTP